MSDVSSLWEEKIIMYLIPKYNHEHGVLKICMNFQCNKNNYTYSSFLSFLPCIFFFSSFTGKGLQTLENTAHFFKITSKSSTELGLIALVCDCSTWKAEGEGLPQVLV